MLNIKKNYNKLFNFFYLLLLYIYIEKYKKTPRPKITIFLPIYNKEKYLSHTLTKLQNQTLKDIEIIAVNDFSNDNSLQILTDFSKKDLRIKIVNNDKNHGLLYSRAMGILHSSGEYLLNLDADDEINGEDTLEYLYNKILVSQVDIISFNVLDKKTNSLIKCFKKNKYLKQPELYLSIFGKDDLLIEYVIWNKLIKREIFLKAYQDFKEKIYNGNWNYFEDDIWNILVNRYAKSRLCIDRLVYIYNYNKGSLMNSRNTNIEFQNLIYRHEMYTKLFPLKNDEKYLIAEYIFLFKRLLSQKNALLLLNNKNINEQIIHIFQNFMNKYNSSKINYQYINNFLNSINSN